jgi:hypothetical protein
MQYILKEKGFSRFSQEKGFLIVKIKEKGQ